MIVISIKTAPQFYTRNRSALRSEIRGVGAFGTAPPAPAADLESGGLPNGALITTSQVKIMCELFKGSIWKGLYETISNLIFGRNKYGSDTI
jgi:hypothetical protein